MSDTTTKEEWEREYDIAQKRACDAEAENARLREALGHASSFAFTYSGTCPHDTFGFNHPDECSVICEGIEPENCWQLYFETKEQADE